MPVKSTRPIKGKTKKTKAKSKKQAMFIKNLTLKKVVMALVILVVAGIGAKLLSKPFASDPYGVTRAANELVIEIVEAHSHGSAVGVMDTFSPPHFMLYGDGTLLCGSDHPSPKKGYELKAGKLTSTEIDRLVKQVTLNKLDGDEEKAHTVQSSYDWPIESVTQILVNYNKGAVEIRGNEQDHTARFVAVESLLNATCEKYAKSDYTPSEYLLRTETVSEDTVGELDEIDSSYSQPSSEGEPQISFIKREEAEAIKSANGDNNYAKVRANGRLFAMELAPAIPEHSPIIPSVPIDEDKVEAASYYPSRWYWFYPSDRSLSSLNTETATISSKVRAFYKQETARDNSAATPTTVKGLQTTSWYQNTCPANFGCSSDKDLNAFRNIRKELQNRKIVPLDGAFAASYNFLYQGPSYRGSAWCYGYANQPASVSGSRGDVAITFGYGTTAGACQASSDSLVRYKTPTHEMGHNLGIGHTCSSSTANSIMEVCYSGRYTWPSGYTVTAAQESALRSSSLFLNHLVYGRVVYSGGSTGVSGVSISNCTSGYAATNTNSTGYFSYRFPTRTSYCLRMTAPAGYKITTQNNPEHSSATTYEAQLAGYNCYKQAVSTLCNSSQVTWDMASDLSKNFILTKL